MRNCKYLILFAVLFFPSKIFAQKDSTAKTDITGLWKGTLYNDSTQKYYQYEIGISEEKGKLSGFSHTWFILDDKQFYGVKKIKIRKASDGKIIIEDAGLISNNYPVSPAKGVRQLNILTLEIADSIMTLKGPFTTNRTKEYAPLTGGVSLQRKNDFWQSALVPHLQELGVEKELSFVKKAMEEESAALVKSAKNSEEANDKEMAEKKKEPVVKDVYVKTEEVVVDDYSLLIGSNPPPAKTETQVDKGALEMKAAANKQTDKKEPINKTAVTKTKEKEVAIKQKAEPAKLIPPTLPAADVAIRQTVIQQTVYFSSDSLRISLFDNGEVDGDTVSVLMNGKIIMEKEGLSTNAVRKTLFPERDADSIELVMYAENLGSIPPNTGLLVVQDGKNIYEIRFSGDLKKNASIILKRKK